MISNQYPTIIYGIVNGVLLPLGTLSIGPGGALVLTPTGAGGATIPSDANGNPRIFDPANNGYWTLTAPNGIATFSNFSATP